MSDNDRRRPLCAATRTDGQPCRGVALPDDPHCFAHSRALTERREQARVRGGRNSSSMARALASLPEPLAEMLALLRVAARDVTQGKMPPARATALAAVARAYAQIHDTHVEAIRVEDLWRHLATVRPDLHLVDDEVAS
jgi:hypothetical protein